LQQCECAAKIVQWVVTKELPPDSGIRSLRLSF
jgi:hypothetical protein